MEGYVFPCITSLIVFALLDLPVRGVKLTWMNVPVSRVIMVERALTPLKAIVANVLQASLDYSVMRKTATVTKYHLFVQNVLCVEMNLD